MQTKLASALVDWLQDTPEGKQEKGCDSRHGFDAIQYGQLRELADIAVLPRGLGHFLTEIGDKCRRNKLPRLDALVINKKSGKPGSGLFTAVPDIDWRKEAAECHAQSGESWRILFA